MTNKPILCLDFDGVCHSYTSGWQGAHVCNDKPVPGVFDFIREAQRHFTVCIYSSRSHQPGGIEAMRQWFLLHDGQGLFDRGLQFPEYKPAAQITIDDRAITFEGTWPTLEFLISFKPWNKRVATCTHDDKYGQHS